MDQLNSTTHHQKGKHRGTRNYSNQAQGYPVPQQNCLRNWLLAQHCSQ